jgi:hypothetical protein
MAVEIRKMGADAAQVDEPVDGSKQVASGDVILKREFVKQRRLRFLLWSHHRKPSRSIRELNQQFRPQSSMSFSTKSAHCVKKLFAASENSTKVEFCSSSAQTWPICAEKLGFWGTLFCQI